MVSNISAHIPGLFTVVVIAFFTSALDLTLGRIGLMPLQPTQMAILFIGLLAGGELAVAIRDPKRGVTITSSVKQLAAPITFYTLMVTVALLFAGFEGAHWSEMYRWIMLLPLGWVMWICCLIVAAQNPLKDAALKGLFYGFILICGSVIYEIFFPASFSRFGGRASGFAGNSNFGALATTMLLASVLNYGERGSRFRDLVLLVFALVAVAATQSRSGLIEIFVVLCVWALSFIGKPILPLRQLAKMAALTVLFIVIALSGFSMIVSQGAMFSSESSRFAKILAGKNVDDGAADERIQVALEAIELITEAPILGHGTGHVRKMRVPPHNQYLQQWVNNGIVGVMSYLLLLVSSLILFVREKFFPGIAFAMVAIVGSFFSHNILDQRTFILVLAILLARVANLAQREVVAR